MGVSLTGIMDNPLTNGSKGKLDELLEELRDVPMKQIKSGEKTWNPNKSPLLVSNLLVQLVSC